MRLDAFAEGFVAAGYACLGFDCRFVGVIAGEPRRLLDIKSQIADWAAAVDYVLPRRDRSRAGRRGGGTSFGGGHAILISANDPRIVAAIAQCPFTDGLASLHALPLSATAKVAARVTRDALGHLLGRLPMMIPTVGAPDSTALMTAPDAMPGYLTGSQWFGNRESSRGAVRAEHRTAQVRTCRRQGTQGRGPPLPRGTRRHLRRRTIRAHRRRPDRVPAPPGSRHQLMS